MTFNTVQVGRKIKELRMKNNMTQMNLADLLGVSYQAVSNWERGNSMPDISKLSELSAAFHCTIDELLGNSPETELIKTAVQMEESGSVPVETPDIETLSHVAPVLKPNQTAQLVERIAEKPKAEHGFTLNKLVELAPFLDDKMLDSLIERALENEGSVNPKVAIALAPFLNDQFLNRLAASMHGNMHDLIGLAPFLSDEALNELAKNAEGNLEDMRALAPFLSDKALDTLAEKAADGNFEDLIPLASFLSEETLNKVVLRTSESNVDEKHLAALAPFLSSETLDALVEKLIAKGKVSSCRRLYPFLSSKSLHKILEAFLASGSVEDLKGLARYI